MHERRNFVLTLLFIAAAAWGVYVWIAVEAMPGLYAPNALLTHRVSVVVALCALGAWLLYVYRYEDKLRDDLGARTMGVYYEADGLCFAPCVRVAPREGAEGGAEISLYYQNRFSGPCEAVIQLRPPDATIHSSPGARDIHFAFSVPPGAFGVIHQPIGVEHHIQGEPIEIKVAAQVRYPHGHGDCLRSHCGRPCGSFDVDWALAFRQGRHELGGEIELKGPASMRLTMPDNVHTSPHASEYTIELFHAVS